MRRSSVGITLLELLIAIVVLALIFVVLGGFIVQQTRATALSQAINEAEALGRTVAESVLQDLQIAGSRVAVVSGVPEYHKWIGDPDGGCTEISRDTCVVPIFAASSDSIAGLTVFYVSSVDPAGRSCRRVDYVHDPGESLLLRSDVPSDCELLPEPDVEKSLARFASDVTAFSVTYVCSDGVRRTDPRDCYTIEHEEESERGFVRQAEVSVTITLTRRDPVTQVVTMSASTPNLRPGVDFLRDIFDDND